MSLLQNLSLLEASLVYMVACRVVALQFALVDDSHYLDRREPPTLLHLTAFHRGHCLNHLLRKQLAAC